MPEALGEKPILRQASVLGKEQERRMADRGRQGAKKTWYAKLADGFTKLTGMRSTKRFRAPRGPATLDEILTPPNEKTVPIIRRRANASPAAHDSSVMPEATERRCPKCSSPMERRVAGQGIHAGRAYLGCSRFPDCNGRLEI